MISLPSWVPILGSSDEEELSLREFIYLDEVAVISLLSSLTREITEVRTDTETTESRKKWKGKLKAFTSKLPGFSGSREKLRINKNTEEVVRRSEIQSKFDELYAETSDHFEINENVNKPISEIDEGGVMEIEIKFSAHELYHYYKAYQYIFDVFEEHVEELTEEDKKILDLMGELFGDYQIPVVGVATNYKVVDNQIFSTDAIDEEMEDEKLQLVGTLDPDMLWEDPSAILYEENKFKAYVRIPESELQDEWDPVKLTRVIKSISRPIGEQLRGMIEAGLREAKEELDRTDLDDEIEDGNSIQNRYHTYFDYIEEMEDIDIEPEQRRELIREGRSEMIRTQGDSDLEIEIELLKEVAELTEDEYDLELDKEELSDKRLAILTGQSDQQIASKNIEEGNYLEVSFVAIYW